MYKPQVDSFGKDNTFDEWAPIQQIFSAFLGLHLSLCSWMISQVVVTMQGGEGGLGLCWGTYAQLERNWTRVIDVRLRSMTLVLETCLYLPITRSCHHRSLDYMPPLLLFIYSFIHSSHPFSKYEHLLWASTIPHARNDQSQREMVSATTWLIIFYLYFSYGNYEFSYLGKYSVWCHYRCLIHLSWCFTTKDNWYVMKKWLDKWVNK